MHMYHSSFLFLSELSCWSLRKTTPLPLPISALITIKVKTLNSWLLTARCDQSAPCAGQAALHVPVYLVTGVKECAEKGAGERGVGASARFGAC